MAFTSVQIGVAVSGTGSVAATLPAPSTAGTLLVACLFNTAGNNFTAPAGWVFAAGGSFSGTTVFYYANNPGGITTATFTSAGNDRGCLSEFSTAAGTTQSVDATGTAAAAPPATSFPLTAGSSSGAGDLGIAAYLDSFTTATTGATWTIPAGYTALRTIANQKNSFSASYKTGLASGVQTVTASYSSSAGQAGWGGVFVAFKENAAAGLSVTTTSPMPGGSVGLPYNQALSATGGTPPYTWSISAGSLPAGTSLASTGGRGGLSGVTMAAAEKPSPTVATANWEALTGINCTGRKCYFQTNPDGSGIFPLVPENTITDCLNNNLVLYLCVKPALNPPTTRDYNALQASVQAMTNLGLTVKVIIWQEVEDQVSNPVLYKAGLVFYAPAIHAVPGALLCHDSAGSKHLLWSSFFPSGPSLAVVDEYMIDFYANTYASGTRIDPFMAMAAGTGKRVGVGEMGSSLGSSAVPPDTGPGSVTEYLQYLQGFAAALPPGLYAWYQQTNKNVNNIISDPSDFRIPLLQAIDTTIAGGTVGGGAITGTPTAAATSSFTAKATDTNAVTATAALQITITGSAGPPVITTTSLPAATVGVAYALTSLTETGGTAPFTWTVTAGALPDGLTMGPLGFIFGTPAADAATSGFTVTVTDASNLTGTAALFITVVASLTPPPNPAPPRPGWPQIVIEAGLSAAAPQVPAGTFILDDPVYGQLSEGNMLGDSTTWTDITLFARTATLGRTSTRVQGPLITYQAGTVSVTLKNGDGRFDPDNAASPYAGSIRPMVPFRARAIYGSVSYPLWSGFADSWGTPGTNLGPNYTETTVSGSDGFKILAGVTVPAGGGTDGDGDGEDSGARVTRILNAAAWYTDHRKISAGDSPVQGTFWGDTALNLLQLTTDSEIGELYMDGAGFVVFRNRQAILEDARSAQVQAVFGDAPGTVHGALTELAYLTVARADDDTQLCNDVQATSVGGTLQEAQSLTSQRTYLFPRTYARSDLLLVDDPTTLEWAQWVLAVSLAGDDRFDALTVSPLRDPGLWPQVLGREIGDRVTVIRRPPGGVAAITRDCFIRGITHTIDASAGTWQTQWDLQSALRYTGFLILDDPVFGKLDTGKLAF